MRDYIELGSVPVDEDCVQVSTKEPYIDAMREECRRYKSYLEQVCPIPGDVSARYIIKTFPHDFGSYMEVCIVFDDEDEKASEFAYNLEDKLPCTWGENNENKLSICY